MYEYTPADQAPAIDTARCTPLTTMQAPKKPELRARDLQVVSHKGYPHALILCHGIVLGDVQRRSASSAWSPLKAATGTMRDGVHSFTEMCVAGHSTCADVHILQWTPPMQASES
jgi:hypothetical protein